MAYACKILADSISPAGHRITSWEATFPRIILAEVNTHCALSRNSASSRAIPVAKRIAAVQEDPFVPEAFGRNQKGMQPGEALDGEEKENARKQWLLAMARALECADELAELGVHKQYANRLLEPFAWHTAVITATDVDNLFNLRVNPLAQGEFQKIARMMKEARDTSVPRPIDYYNWHTPYVGLDEAFNLNSTGGPGAWKVSVGRCARVSYLTQNGVRNPEEDAALADRLLENGHMSPLEHVARPMTEEELEWIEAWDVALDDGPIIRVRLANPCVGSTVFGSGSRDPVITHVRGPLHYSGKLNGWISRRAYVRGEHDILGHRAAL